MVELLRSALAAPFDPPVPGSEKWGTLAQIADRLICQKGGADVVFAPGLFDEHWARAEGLWREDDVPSGDRARSAHQTTCIACDVRRGQANFTV